MRLMQVGDEQTGNAMHFRPDRSIKFQRADLLCPEAPDWMLKMAQMPSVLTAIWNAFLIASPTVFRGFNMGLR